MKHLINDKISIVAIVYSYPFKPIWATLKNKPKARFIRSAPKVSESNASAYFSILKLSYAMLK